MRRSRTRYERRQRMKNAAMIAATMILWAVVICMMFQAWANEKPVTEAEHRAYIESLKGGE